MSPCDEVREAGWPLVKLDKSLPPNMFRLDHTDGRQDWFHVDEKGTLTGPLKPALSPSSSAPEGKGGEVDCIDWERIEALRVADWECTPLDVPVFLAAIDTLRAEVARLKAEASR